MCHGSNFLAHAGNVRSGNHGTTIAKRIADIRSHVGDPLVVVHRHRDHLRVVSLTGDWPRHTVKQDADDGVAMAPDVCGIRQGRRNGQARLESVHGHALAVIAVAREAEFAVDGLTADELFILFLGVISTPDRIAPSEHHRTEFLHALGGRCHEGLLEELRAVRPSLDLVRAEELRRHEELQHHRGILVGREFTELGEEGLIARPDEAFARAQALGAEMGVRIG